LPNLDSNSSISSSRNSAAAKAKAFTFSIIEILRKEGEILPPFPVIDRNSGGYELL
jgi:hypothetical protein